MEECQLQSLINVEHNIVGVVMFDIDQTLTCPNSANAECSDDNNKKYKIDCLTLCNKNNVQIAINTARQEQDNILHSIPVTVLCLLHKINIIYTRNPEYRNVEEDKFQKMQYHSKKYNIPLKKIILIDDRLKTCKYIRKKKGKCIHVKKKNGITKREYDKLKIFIKRLKSQNKS